VAADHFAERVKRGERHEHAALVGADAGAAEPAVDDMRLAEDQELAAQHAVARRAQDDVACLQGPIDLLDQPRLDGEVLRRLEADEVGRLMMAADARMLDPHDLLRGNAAQAGKPCLGQRVGIEHQLRRLDDQQRRGDVGKRPLGHHHHVGAQAGEAHRHAAVDALHQHGAGEDDAAAQGHRRDQQEAARLAAPEVLEGEAQQQPAHQSVQDRVCFMCSSLVGMMTQS
jgi:hypothetical protein